MTGADLPDYENTANWIRWYKRRPRYLRISIGLFLVLALAGNLLWAVNRVLQSRSKSALEDATIARDNAEARANLEQARRESIDAEMAKQAGQRDPDAKAV